MAHINITQVELKKQKNLLARYVKFLPTLELKKKQLMLYVHEIRDKILEVQNQEQDFLKNLKRWIAVFGDDIDKNWLPKFEIITFEENVAGTRIPSLKAIKFQTQIKPENLRNIPLWFDKGEKALREAITFKVKIELFEKQIKLLEKELEKTTQKINLFEKRKIPEHRANISKIKIGLGDLQTNAVVRGKIAKNKAELKRKKQV